MGCNSGNRWLRKKFLLTLSWDPPPWDVSWTPLCPLGTEVHLLPLGRDSLALFQIEQGQLLTGRGLQPSHPSLGLQSEPLSQRWEGHCKPSISMKACEGPFSAVLAAASHCYLPLNSSTSDVMNGQDIPPSPSKDSMSLQTQEQEFAFILIVSSCSISSMQNCSLQRSFCGLQRSFWHRGRPHMR